MIKSTYKSIIACPDIRTQKLYSGASDHHISLDGVKIETKRYAKRTDLRLRSNQPRKTHINRTKVANKVIAFKNVLPSSVKLKFYSISFPFGMPDMAAKKALNIWLTVCRKYYNLVSYIWVAERQSNGTIHFHMVTNAWMNISVVNYSMACAISTVIRTEKLQTLKYRKRSYNGVDVETVYNSSDLSKYITKYITKNKEEIIGMAWRSSQNISRIMTSIQIDYNQFQSVRNYINLVMSYTIDIENDKSGLQVDVWSNLKGLSPPYSSLITKYNKSLRLAFETRPGSQTSKIS